MVRLDTMTGRPSVGVQKSLTEELSSENVRANLLKLCDTQGISRVRLHSICSVKI